MSAAGGSGLAKNGNRVNDDGRDDCSELPELVFHDKTFGY
jgi:hypothetical protein